MKRIGIMSMQRIANYGSFLQAYALSRMLEEEGAEVVFIDFHPAKCLDQDAQESGSTWSKIRKYMHIEAPFFQKIAYLIHKKRWHSRYDRYLGITDERVYSAGTDTLVIGSDEVFNCTQRNCDIGYTRELFGRGHQSENLVTYAASFGNTTLEKLDHYQIETEISGMLEHFRYLSVRDDNSRQIVEMLVNRTPQLHLDPVLIYDFWGKCKEIPKSVKEKDYLIVYAYPGRMRPEECAAIQEYADEYGKKILCIGGVQPIGRFVDCSPFEVPAYFRHADAVVTDTFHGTVFSVIASKQAAVIVRESGTSGEYGNEEKLADLLVRLKIENQQVRNPGQIREKLEQKTDYIKTWEILSQERRRTKEYLKKIAEL